MKYPPQKIEPKFSTAEEARDTYCQAFLHRDWATVYETPFEEYRLLYLGSIINESHGMGALSPVAYEALVESRTALLKKYGMSTERYESEEELMADMQKLKDPAAMYAELMDWMVKQKNASPAVHWEDILREEVHKVASVVVFHYQYFATEGDGFIVLENRDGRWGLESRKTSNMKNDIMRIRARTPEADSLAEAIVQMKKIGKLMSFRFWTSANGKRKIEAKLTLYEDGVLHLQRKDGTVVKVPFKQLSDADQKFLKQE